MSSFPFTYGPGGMPLSVSCFQKMCPSNKIRGRPSLRKPLPFDSTVYTVESNGSGFLKDGRPRILFEGHIFWKQLTDKGIPPGPYVKGNEDILYPKWTKQYYSHNP